MPHHVCCLTHRVALLVCPRRQTLSTSHLNPSQTPMETASPVTPCTHTAADMTVPSAACCAQHAACTCAEKRSAFDEPIAKHSVVAALCFNQLSRPADTILWRAPQWQHPKHPPSLGPHMALARIPAALAVEVDFSSTSLGTGRKLANGLYEFTTHPSVGPRVQESFPITISDGWGGVTQGSLSLVIREFWVDAVCWSPPGCSALQGEAVPAMPPSSTPTQIRLQRGCGA